MFDFFKIPDWLKLGAREIGAIAICSGLLLFLPNSFLVQIGIITFTEKYKMWISIIWILSISILSSYIIAKLLESGKEYYNIKRLKRFRIKRLKELTPEEKKVLSKYINNETRTQPFNYSDGVIKELETHKILYRASDVAYRHTTFPFNINEWAWKYLNKNKHLLD